MVQQDKDNSVAIATVDYKEKVNSHSMIDPMHIDAQGGSSEAVALDQESGEQLFPSNLQKSVDISTLKANEDLVVSNFNNLFSNSMSRGGVPTISNGEQNNQPTTKSTKSSTTSTIFDNETRTVSQSRKKIILYLTFSTLIIAGFVAVGISCGINKCKPTKSPTRSELTTQPNFTTSTKFQSTNELYAAVDEYVSAGENAKFSSVVVKYGYPIGIWDVSQLTNFSRVFDPARQGHLYFCFEGYSPFNEDISQWNTSRATTMLGMFHCASSFDGDISAWDTSRVTDMSVMFSDAHSFNGNISAWNTSSVTDISFMFNHATSFDQNLCSWGSKLYSGIAAYHVFASSGCPNMFDPLIENGGPFCFDCN